MYETLIKKNKDFQEQGFFTLLDIKICYDPSKPQRIINKMLRKGIIVKDKMERRELYPDGYEGDKRLTNIYRFKNNL